MRWIDLEVRTPTQLTIFTHRDLGTEGAEDADISLRKCLSGPNPLIPGPRYFCANRAIVCTGSYGEIFFVNFSSQKLMDQIGPKSSLHLNQEGVEGVTGAEAADGVDDCIRVTRRQIGAGADWIKVSNSWIPDVINVVLTFVNHRYTLVNIFFCSLPVPVLAAQLFFQTIDSGPVCKTSLHALQVSYSQPSIRLS